MKHKIEKYPHIFNFTLKLKTEKKADYRQIKSTENQSISMFMPQLHT